jgi:hypothetical protein
MKTNVYIFPDALKHASNNSLDITKIRFSDTPYKKLCHEATVELKKDTYTHFIDIYYKNHPLIIQLPKYKIKSIDNNKMVIHVDDKIFQYLISPLEEHIIQATHNNSEKWFSGKKFTMNKIMNSIVSPFNKNENESTTLKLALNKNTMYFNRYKTLINQSDIICSEDVELICLVKIANIQFLQNKFSYNIVLEQAKVFMEERLVEYSIIDDPDDKISESVSADNTCENEYYQESIDSSKIEFF